MLLMTPLLKRKRTTSKDGSFSYNSARIFCLTLMLMISFLLTEMFCNRRGTASFLYVISIMTVEGGQKKFEGGKSFSHKTKRSDFSFGVGVRLQLENETVFVSSVGAPEEREGQ